jgi:putative transposase
MARLARVVAVGTPHHVTQRGNARRFILESDADRLVYLQLLRQSCRLHRLSLLGYCLMSNHVHLVVVPERPDSLAAALKLVHGRYAAYFNASRLSSGHVWQGRFYSCPLDPPHLWAALRYAELNPVRAGLVTEPEAFPWSSAAIHCAPPAQYSLLDLAPWLAVWSPQDWRKFLAETVPTEQTAAIRRSTHTGRPLGSPGFVRGMELTLRRRLTPEKGGRPPKGTPAAAQQLLAFAREG